MVVYSYPAYVMVGGFRGKIILLAKGVDNFQGDLHDLRANPVPWQGCKA